MPQVKTSPEAQGFRRKRCRQCRMRDAHRCRIPFTCQPRRIHCEQGASGQVDIGSPTIGESGPNTVIPDTQADQVAEQVGHHVDVRHGCVHCRIRLEKIDCRARARSSHCASKSSQSGTHDGDTQIQVVTLSLKVR
jgi:hypothetical protein